MKTNRVVAALICGAISFGVSQVHAGIIGVDFQDNDGTGDASGAAVIGAAGDVWNVFTGGGGSTIAGTYDLNLVDGTTDSGIDLTIVGDARYAGGDFTGLVNPFAGYAFLVDPSVTMTLSGFAQNETADIYLYAGKGNNQFEPASFTIGGTTKIVADSASDATSYTEGQEYVVFSGVSADASGNIEITWAGVDGYSYSAFDGMQVNVIPEPATLGLVAVFGGSVLVIRRRFMM